MIHVSLMYKKISDNVEISVESFFLEEQSNPRENHFVWAYRVTIQNLSKTRIQLKSRHWRIVDSSGHIQEISGDGVVGEQPTLDPGETYEYTSGTPLTTPSGIMGGTYFMSHANGNEFEAEVPTFSLDSPHENAILH